MPASQPTVLVTRPQPAAGSFAERLRGMGLRTLVAPLMRIAPVAHDAAAVDAARGLVFTSVHGVAAAGKGRGRPAFCVGGATAEAARAAGYIVTTGPGDAAGLMPMLTGLDEGWLHPHGRHVAARLPVRGMVVYDQLALPLSTEAAALLAGDGPVIWPVMSPRSARLACEAAHGVRAPIFVAAISPAAALAWSPAPARIETSATPDAEGVIAAIRSLLRPEISAPDAG